MFLAAGSLLTVWWLMWSLGPRLQQPLSFWLWLSHTYLSASQEGGPYLGSQLALLWYLLGRNTLFCDRTRGHHAAFDFLAGKALSFLFRLSGDPRVWVALSHYSVRLFSGHSSPILTLRTNR